MNKSRIDYENLIHNSILFSLNRDTQAVAYRREALKMVEYLYFYINSFNSEKYKEFSLEITETANRCIKNYVPEYGDFLNYFNAAIAKEYRKAFAKNKLMEQHGGVHIPEDDIRIIRKYIKYAEHKGYYDLDNESITAIASATEIAQERILNCISNYQRSFSISDSYSIDDDTVSSLFDFIPCDKSTYDSFSKCDAAIEILEHINEIFITRQSRQKPLLAKLITAKIAFCLLDDEKILCYARQMDFFDNDIFALSLKRGSTITAKEIANNLGITEQSVSRTYKVFISLI